MKVSGRKLHTSCNLDTAADELLQCVGESHIFLCSVEPELTNGTSEDLQIMVDQSGYLLDTRGGNDTWLCSNEIAEIENTSETNKEFVIGESTPNCNQKQICNLEENDVFFYGSDIPVTPSGIMQVSSGWTFLEMTPGCYLPVLFLFLVYFTFLFMYLAF